MADRPNQFNGYPMIPNNFNMNLLQQQQQQQQQMQQLVQQQQQNALNQARGMPGMSNSENQQMWQQLQLQHRSQMGGMDGMGNQGMAQVRSLFVFVLHNLFRLSVAFRLTLEVIGDP